MAKAKCAGTNRAGGPCRLYPMLGTTVCRSHGGAAPQVKAAAARRVVEAKALRAVQGLGTWQPVTDPLSALADVAGEVLAVKDHLRGLVGRIVERERQAEHDAVAMASARLTGESVGLRVPDDKGAEQMRAEFTAYMAMLNSAVATLATIAKLNIDERMARIDEMRAEMIREALRRTFAELGIAGEQQARAFGVLGTHLRVVKREGER
jgi:hypothetical protein